MQKKKQANSYFPPDIQFGNVTVMFSICDFDYIGSDKEMGMWIISPFLEMITIMKIKEEGTQVRTFDYFVP